MTCGASRDRAITAAEAGADYVAFGAFFPSMTKTATKYRADPGTAARLERDDGRAVLRDRRHHPTKLRRRWSKRGADFLAVIGAIWSHPKGPRAAVAEFNEVFARYGRAYLSC